MASPQLAKLTTPRLGKVYLRTRLFKALEAARDKPVIWICAPAGAGKTTLVASYLQHKKIKPLWYQVDEGDADLASFFYYLGLLGKQAAPRKKKDLPLLTPEYLLGLPVFTRNFFRELFARMKANGVLVFDNFQESGTDAALHQFLPQALAEIPKGINVVIISRSDPPASLTRLQASDEMAVLRWDDLRLTEEEGVGIGTLRSQDKRADDAFYRELTKLTDGWVTGLVLYLEHAAGTAVPDAIKQHPDQKAVFDYFAGEILNRLDARSQTILQRTAFLPKISVTAARERSGDATADQLLEELADRNAFTVRHTGTATTYEYHPLFREFLQARARQTLGAEELNTLLRESSWQLESTGHIEDAIELLQQAQDWGESARIIVGVARTMIEQGRGLTVAEWIRFIPNDVLTNQPWLLYWLGIAKLPFNPPEARSALESFYGYFKNGNDTAGMLLAWCAIIDTFIFEYGDFHPLDHWIAEMDAWLKENREFPSPEIQARVTCGMFTALMWRQPFRDDLREIWLPGVSEMVLYGESPQLRIQYGGLLFLYYSHWIGDCAKGKALLDALSDLKDQADVPPLVQLVWYFHAGIQLFITGHIEQSRQTQKQGLRVTDEYGLRIFDSTLSSMLFYSSLLVADMEDMEIFRQRMRSTLNESSHVDVCQYHMTLAYKAVCANEVAEAREHTDRAIDAGNKCGALFFDSYAKTADALVTAHEGKFPEALALFKEVHADTRKNHFASLETASYFFEAELFLRKGELEGCLAPLRDALSLARRTGVNNPLWWRDTVMSRLFAIALAHEIETDYVRFLIRQRQLVSPDDIPVPDAWPFPVRIYTLGRFSLVIDDKPVVFKGKAPKKALELLKALIAFGGREVSTEKLTEALWPDAEGDAAYQNFTMALKRLREILAHKDALNLTEGKLTLDPRYVWVDTWAFERGAHEGDPARRAHALGLYKGLFLGNEADAPWLLSPRERLQQSCLRGLKAHGQYLEDKTEYDQAAALYEQALATDPLDETFYQGLLRCQLALGRIADATRTYQRCEAVLKEALGVGPSPQTVALFRDSVN